MTTVDRLQQQQEQPPEQQQAMLHQHAAQAALAQAITPTQPAAAATPHQDRGEDERAYQSASGQIYTNEAKTAAHLRTLQLARSHAASSSGAVPPPPAPPLSPPPPIFIHSEIDELDAAACQGTEDNVGNRCLCATGSHSTFYS